MRAMLLSAAATIFLIHGAVAPAMGQGGDDAAICKALQKSGPGLYLAHVGRGDAPDFRRVIDGPMTYSPEDRFYFLPDPQTQSTEEGRESAWHLRTQTHAVAAGGADAAYVYRAATKTRCHPDSDLRDLPPNDRFIPLASYRDHHPRADETPREKSEALRQRFHFEIQDPQTGCIATDDLRYFRDLDAIYGFQETARPQTAWERDFTISQTALAQPKGEKISVFAGLSSEFAYSQSFAACFSFTGPLPTRIYQVRRRDRYDNALAGAKTWHPIGTLVVLKHLRGREVTEVVNRWIGWIP